ncbi:MAG: sulfatase [Bacteroidetes bacterium]|nr:MAG: sulfatase [Bacteroidota bacterium]
MDEKCNHMIRFPSILRMAFSFTVMLMLVQCTGGPELKKPNIIVILADDLGWADVGYNGAEYYETPNLDRLASQGMVLSRFYPSAANCSPSRACLMTGMYSPRHSVYLPQGFSRGGEVSSMRWKTPARDQDSSFFTFPVSINTVDPSFVSLAEMLKGAGYVSARLGKWHIGDDNQGFDVNSSNGIPRFTSNRGGEEGRFYDDTAVAERLTDAAMDFIGENRDRPFFLYLSHWEVHTPMRARRDRIGYYEKKLESTDGVYNPVYAAEVEQVDLSLGRIMNRLEELGLARNTLLIFTSDNGGLSGLTNNAPLRAGKGSFYEGGIRVPCVIRWPDVIREGRVSDFPVSGIDFMPSFAEITGAELPASQPVDGISLLPLLRGEALEEDRTLFFHFPLYLGGSRGISFLPAYDSGELMWRAVPSTTVMKGPWKLIYYYEYDSYELFNLEKDISEQHDLSQLETKVAEELLGEIRKWCSQVEAPIPVVPNEILSGN